MTQQASMSSSHEPVMTNGYNKIDDTTSGGRSFPQPQQRSLREVCADLNRRVTSFLSEDPKKADGTEHTALRRAQEQTRVALGVLDEALKRYDFNALSLSYNGGKDCQVLLILYLAALHTHFEQKYSTSSGASTTTSDSTLTTISNAITSSLPSSLTPDSTSSSSSTSTKKDNNHFPDLIPSIYAKPPDPFPCVSSFVDYSTQEYHLDLTHISTNPGPDKKSKSHSSPPPTAITPLPSSPSEAKALSSHPVESTMTTNQTLEQQKEEQNRAAEIIQSSSTDTTTCTCPKIQSYQPNKNNNHTLPLSNTAIQSHLLSNGTITNNPNTNTNNNTNPTNTDTTSNQPKITFRDAFTLYLKTNPQIQAIFVGTRRTDPHGATLQHFQMTDGNWPRFMRIHPVIDWTLSDVWLFLRSPHLRDPVTGGMLEYCHMYDRGYTSLGGVEDTVRNPRLRVVGEDGVEKYRPAYEMVDDDGERLGRE